MPMDVRRQIPGARCRCEKSEKPREGLDIWSPFAGSSVCRLLCLQAHNTTETYACRGCSPVSRALSQCLYVQRHGGVGRARLGSVKPMTWSKQLGLLTLIILINTSQSTQTTKSERRCGRVTSCIFSYSLPTPLPTPAYKRRSRNQISVPDGNH